MKEKVIERLNESGMPYRVIDHAAVYHAGKYHIRINPEIPFKLNHQLVHHARNNCSAEGIAVSPDIILAMKNLGVSLPYLFIQLVIIFYLMQKLRIHSPGKSGQFHHLLGLLVDEFLITVFLGVNQQFDIVMDCPFT